MNYPNLCAGCATGRLNERVASIEARLAQRAAGGHRALAHTAPHDGIAENLLRMEQGLPPDETRGGAHLGPGDGWQYRFLPAGDGPVSFRDGQPLASQPARPAGWSSGSAGTESGF
jgi:hypothetical protein